MRSTQPTSTVSHNITDNNVFRKRGLSRWVQSCCIWRLGRSCLRVRVSALGIRAINRTIIQTCQVWQHEQRRKLFTRLPSSIEQLYIRKWLMIGRRRRAKRSSLRLAAVTPSRGLSSVAIKLLIWIDLHPVLRLQTFAIDFGRCVPRAIRLTPLQRDFSFANCADCSSWLQRYCCCSAQSSHFPSTHRNGALRLSSHLVGKT